MLASAVVLLLLLAYLWRRGQHILFLIVLSILPQYHFRYWLYSVTGFSNHGLVYGDFYNHNILSVNYYLDSLLCMTGVIVYIYAQFFGRTHEPKMQSNLIVRRGLYRAILLYLFCFALFFRLFSRQAEELFSTFVLAVLMAVFAFAGIHSKKTSDRLFVILFGSATAVLIGFKSVLLLLFVSLFLSEKKIKNALWLALILIVLMMVSSIIRGVEATSINLLAKLIFSHYDSWSFLVVSFSDDRQESFNNLISWASSFLTMVPGLSSLFGLQSYGHYLNMEYTSDWYEWASVLLAPGIIGEFWSLGGWVPFFALPLVIISYARLSQKFSCYGLPYRVVMVSSAIFLLEAPLSNLGQMVKLLLMVYCLSKLLCLKVRMEKA